MLSRAENRDRIGERLDLEAISALKPDLVIAWETGNPAGQVEKLKALGLTVYASQPNRMEDIAAQLERFGQLAGSVTAAFGLTSLGGHAQMVRPLIAPMAEGAAETEHGPLTNKARFRIRGMAAGTDNIGLFFGEDIFIAIGSIVLMVGFLEQAGIIVEPLQLSVWAIPTAIAAFAVLGLRLLMFDREIRRDLAARDAEAGQ